MSPTSSPRFAPETWGLFYGFLGVACFSLTLPATRVAVADLDPMIVGLGRALAASVLAALYLLGNRKPWPTRAQWGCLGIVAAGVVVGFPFLSAWAIHRVPASHGAIVLGLLPLATAVGAAVRAGERPSRAFWVSSLAGSALVMIFALASGGGHFQSADVALLGAVVAAGVGYAEGGRLAREMGGAPAMCWALLLAAPLLVLPVGYSIRTHGLSASPASWLGFAYVTIFSVFLGMFAWYHGLSLGGIARVGQLQLLQPFLTLFASALLLHEKVTPITVGFALAVVICVAIGRKTAVVRSR